MDVSFDASLSSSTAPTTLALDASAASDPLGRDLAAYRWTVTDAAGEEVRTGSGRMTSMSLLNPGDYVVTLTVTDLDGKQGVASETVSVKSTTEGEPGGLDVQFAATPSGTTAPVTVLLDASGTVASPGAVVDSFDWKVTDSDGETVQIAAGRTSAVSLLDAGDYTISLTVVDSAGEQGIANETMTVENPSAGQPAGISVGFSALASDAFAPVVVTLDATESTGSDGAKITDFAWTVIDETDTEVQTAAGRITNVALTRAGSYTIRLTATDANGLQGVASRVVVVKHAEIDVLFQATPTPDDYTAPSTLVLDGSETVASTGAVIAQYSWTVSDGDGNEVGNASGRKTSLALTNAGEYLLTLAVTDADGNAGSATQIIELTETAPPAAGEIDVVMAITPQDPMAPVTLLLDASQSTANTGHSITSYRWEAKNSTGDTVGAATGRITNMGFLRSGDYTMTLTVTDSAGNEGVASQTIQIRSTQLAVSFSAVPDSTTAPANVTLDATATTSAVSAEMDRYLWAIVAANGNTIQTATGETALVSLLAPGDYTVTLEVLDKNGNQGSATQTLSLEPGAVTVDFNIQLPEPPEAPATVVLDARATASNSNADLVSFDWEVTDVAGASVATANGQQTSIALLNSGQYVVSLTVTDADGNEATGRKTVQVPRGSEGQARGIDVVFVATPDGTSAPATVALDATGTISNTGATIANYQWTLRDEAGTTVATATGRKTSLAVMDAGMYSVTLVVTDTAENTGTGSETLTLAYQDPDQANDMDVAFNLIPSEPVTAPATIVLDASPTSASRPLASFVWTATNSEGNSQVVNGRKTSIAFFEPGEYLITLTATDVAGERGVASKTVTLLPNAIDVGFTLSDVATGAMVTGPLTAPATIAVVAEVSSSSAPVSTYAWEVRDSAGSLVQTAAGRNSTLALLSAGEYQIRLTARDEQGDQGSSLRSVSVVDPLAGQTMSIDVRFDALPSSTQAPATVSLDAAGTIANTGNAIVSYSWKVTDSVGRTVVTATGYKTAVALLEPDDYQIALTVVDAQGNQGVGSQSLTLGERSSGQAGDIDVAFSVTPTTGTAPVTLSLDASATVVRTGADTVSYQWKATNEGATTVAVASGRQTTMALLEPGFFTMTLTVTDGEGNQGSGERTVALTGSSAPQAGAISVDFSMRDPGGSVIASQSSITAPVTVTLSSMVTLGSNEAVDSYVWQAEPMAGGTTLMATGAQTSVAFLQAGDYTVTLTVTDAAGNEGVASKELRLRGGTTVPLADFDLSPELTAGGEYLLLLDGSASVAHGTARLVGYDWKVTDARTRRVMATSVGETVTVEFSGPPGAYVVGLTVTDNYGATASREETISLRDSIGQALNPQFDVTPGSGPAPLTVDLSWPAGNADPGGLEIVAFRWRLVDTDGTVLVDYMNTGPVTSMAIQNAGNYTVELQMTDEYGRTDTATEVVVVQ